MHGRDTTATPRFWSHNSERKLERHDCILDIKGEMGEPLELPEGSHEQKRVTIGMCNQRDYGGDWDFAGGYPDLERGSDKYLLPVNPEDQESAGWSETCPSVPGGSEEESCCSSLKRTYILQMGHEKGLFHTLKAGTIRSPGFSTGFVAGGLVTYVVMMSSAMLIPC